MDARLAALRRKGIRISLDDFGTGYSSLAYLTRLSVDVLKIDRSFVENAAPGSEHGALVEAIVTMAHSLGIHVVAEGVETASELAFLRRCGCEYVQGFLLGRPEPPERMERHLAASRPVSAKA